MEQMEPARAEFGMDLIRDHLCRLFLDELMWSEHERFVFNFRLGGALVPERQRGYEYWFSSDLQSISMTDHGRTRSSQTYEGWDGIGVTQFNGMQVSEIEAYRGMSDEQIVFLNGAPLDQAMAVELASMLAVCIRHAVPSPPGTESLGGRDVHVVTIDDELL
jgi:hypothetical protein